MGGLSQDSVVLCEQIRVVDKHRIIKVLGRLDEPSLGRLKDAVCTILGV